MTRALFWAIFRAILFGVSALSVGLFCIWLQTVPRDPGGIVCRQSTPLTSFSAFLRGQQEIGCTHFDTAIIEAPLRLSRK